MTKDTIVCNVAELASTEVAALEHLLGKKLQARDRVVLGVIPAMTEPDVEGGTGGAEMTPSVPDWWNIYEGLTDDEIDRLDEAIRRRADLTREFD